MQMIRLVTEPLEWVWNLWLRVNIALDGYRVAAVILLAMAYGAELEPNNVLFTLIQQETPFLNVTLWKVWFLLSAWIMWDVKPGRFEVPSVVFFFVMPVGYFYYKLLDLTVEAGRSGPFVIILILLALITPVFLVTRTAAFNYYRDHTPQIAEENQKLREKNKRICEERDGLKEKLKHYEPAEAAANE